MTFLATQGLPTNSDVALDDVRVEGDCVFGETTTAQTEAATATYNPDSTVEMGIQTDGSHVASTGLEDDISATGFVTTEGYITEAPSVGTNL